MYHFTNYLNLALLAWIICHYTAEANRRVVRAAPGMAESLIDEIPPPPPVPPSPSSILAPILRPPISPMSPEPSMPLGPSGVTVTQEEIMEGPVPPPPPPNTLAGTTPESFGGSSPGLILKKKPGYNKWLLKSVGYSSYGRPLLYDDYAQIKKHYAKPPYVYPVDDNIELPTPPPYYGKPRHAGGYFG